MENQEILQEVMRRAKNDPWCMECLQDVQRHEGNYLTIRGKLSPEEQEQLDLYIGACEAFCDAHIFVAHQLGREQRFRVL